jgi:hypothetical protein
MDKMEFSGVFIHLECPSGYLECPEGSIASDKGRRGSTVSNSSIASNSSGRRRSTRDIGSTYSADSTGTIRRTNSTHSNASFCSFGSSDTDGTYGTIKRTGSADSSATNCNTIHKYMIFIKFGDDMIFVDITNVGSIIMPFYKFMKNAYLQKYYRVSLMTIAEKNLVIEKSYYYEKYNADIMDIGREWFIDALYIIEDERTGECEAKNGEHYLNCNPYNLNNMYVETDKEIAEFNKLYDDIYGYEKTEFEEKLISYATQLMNHTRHLMKLKLNYIYSIKEHET